MMNETDCGPVIDDAYVETWSGFVYWCEGVLMLPVGLVGLIGNVLSVGVLSSAKLSHRVSFHYLLLCLSVCDIVFIVTSVPVHVFPTVDWELFNWIASTRLFGLLYVTFLYPFTTISYCAGVYLIMGITVER